MKTDKELENKIDNLITSYEISSLKDIAKNKLKKGILFLFRSYALGIIVEDQQKSKTKWERNVIIDCKNALRAEQRKKVKI